MTSDNHRHVRRLFKSDLLVRHERLTHRKAQDNLHSPQQQSVSGNTDAEAESRPRKRMRSSFDTGRPAPEIRNIMSPPAVVEMLPAQPYTQPLAPMTFDHGGECSLTALSLAAEYQALQGNMADGAPARGGQLPTPMPSQPGTLSATLGDNYATTPTVFSTQLQGPSFSESLDNLTYFLDSEPLNSYHFTSLMNTEQPMPFLSPDSFDPGQEPLPETNTMIAPPSGWRQNQVEEPHSLSRFGSRFPSLQPDDLTSEERSRTRSFADLTYEDRQLILDMLDEFSSVLPRDFKLPTRLALCRYLAAYINGFHEHMPFLHIPTMTVSTCSVELILALAAIGAQYTFEGEKGVELFNVSRAIATYRIRRWDTRLVHLQRDLVSSPTLPRVFEDTTATYSPRHTGSTLGPLGFPSENDTASGGEDLMQSAQALLLLMALCTWAKHKEILREALAIQSILATLIRDDGLHSEHLDDELSWTSWIRRESIKRTKFIVYGKYQPRSSCLGNTR